MIRTFKATVLVTTDDDENIVSAPYEFSLDELKSELSDFVSLEIDVEEMNIEIDSIEIDWESLKEVAEGDE
jgi:hypothetical protein